MKAAYLWFCCNCACPCHAHLEDKLQAARTSLGFSVESGVLFHVESLAGTPEQAWVEQALGQAFCSSLCCRSGLSCGVPAARHAEITVSGFTSGWTAFSFLSSEQQVDHKGQLLYPNGNCWDGHTCLPTLHRRQHIMRHGHSHHRMQPQNYAVTNGTERNHLALFEAWLMCPAESIVYLVPLRFLWFYSD